MPAFGSGNWPSNYGPIPYTNSATAGGSTAFSAAFSKQAFALPNNTVATTTGTTEGTDLATWTLPAAGLYRVTAYLEVSVASDAGTETVQPVLTYTDVVGAHTAIALNNANAATTNATLDAKATAGTATHWVGVFRATAGSSMAVAIKNILGTSTRTVGKLNANVVVEFIGE